MSVTDINTYTKNTTTTAMRSLNDAPARRLARLVKKNGKISFSNFFNQTLPAYFNRTFNTAFKDARLDQKWGPNQPTPNTNGIKAYKLYNACHIFTVGNNSYLYFEAVYTRWSGTSQLQDYTVFGFFSIDGSTGYLISDIAKVCNKFPSSGPNNLVWYAHSANISESYKPQQICAAYPSTTDIFMYLGDQMYIYDSQGYLDLGTNKGNDIFVLAKFNSSMQIMWRKKYTLSLKNTGGTTVKTYNNSWMDYIVDINNGNLFIFNAGAQGNGFQQRNAIMRVDIATGNFLWQKFCTSSAGYPQCIGILTGPAYVVAFFQTNSFYPDPQTLPNEYFKIVYKVSDGSVMSTKTFLPGWMPSPATRFGAFEPIFNSGYFYYPETGIGRINTETNYTGPNILIMVDQTADNIVKYLVPVTNKSFTITNTMNSPNNTTATYIPKSAIVKTQMITNSATGDKFILVAYSHEIARNAWFQSYGRYIYMTFVKFDLDLNVLSSVEFQTVPIYKNTINFYDDLDFGRLQFNEKVSWTLNSDGYIVLNIWGPGRYNQVRNLTNQATNINQYWLDNIALNPDADTTKFTTLVQIPIFDNYNQVADALCLGESWTTNGFTFTAKKADLTFTTTLPATLPSFTVADKSSTITNGTSPTNTTNYGWSGYTGTDTSQTYYTSVTLNWSATDQIYYDTTQSSGYILYGDGQTGTPVT